MDTLYHEVFETDPNHPTQLLLHQGEVNYVILEHWHKDLELDYFLEGDLPADFGADIWVNGRKFFAGSGSLTLINSGQIHALTPTRQIANSSGQVLAASLIISYDFLRALCPDIDNILFVLEGHDQALAKLKALFHELIELHCGEHSEYLHIQTTAIAMQMIYLLLSSFAKKKNECMLHSQKYIDRLTKVMDYMKENYAKPLTLHGVAEHFSVSEQYLSKIFKSYTGNNFKRYLSKIRLEKAYPDVIRSDYSMMEIAMQSGFSDVRSFISVFKSTYGMPPMQYRKACAGRLGLENAPMMDSRPFIRSIKD